MIGYFLAVKAEQMDELVRDPASVAAFVAEAVEDQDELGADFLDVDKSWHGIHFLLTGAVTGGEPPLAWVVFGPAAIGEDVGYGPARVLTPNEVVEVSKALAPLTAEKLKRRCDWNAMNDREVYPRGWRVGDEDYIGENFAHLKKLFESAARRRMGIVQWISSGSGA
jgi:hypothetical protein